MKKATKINIILLITAFIIGAIINYLETIGIITPYIFTFICATLMWITIYNMAIKLTTEIIKKLKRGKENEKKKQ